MLAQSILNPAFITELAQTNQKKVNMEFIGTKICDALRLRGGDVFIPLTQQDIQRMSQPSPADQLKDKMQQDRLQAQGEQGQEKNAAGIVKELLSKGMDHAMEPDIEGGEGEAPEKETVQ